MKKVLMLLMIFMIFTACHENKRETNPLNTDNGADDWSRLQYKRKDRWSYRNGCSRINDNETLSRKHREKRMYSLRLTGTQYNPAKY